MCIDYGVGEVAQIRIINHIVMVIVIVDVRLWRNYSSKLMSRIASCFSTRRSYSMMGL
jgi:hypothetical protein